MNRVRVCKCDWCKLYDEYKRVMAGGKLAPLKRFTEKIFDLYNHVAHDLNYCEVILDGSWPSAVEQLEEALVQAKGIREKQG